VRLADHVLRSLIWLPPSPPLPPNAGRDAQAEFGAERIAGAAFWDIDGVADPGTDLPHMLPSEGAFAAAADALGIANGDALVVYDGLGMFAAPRAWWTWRVFGHDRWGVQDGAGGALVGAARGLPPTPVCCWCRG
jgi:3-mercaptopyruvate sulfurtransferase SseA